MADPTSKLRFQGDERDLGKSLDRVQAKMSGTTRTITKEASKAETALKGVQSAADKIKPVDVRVTAKTDEYMRKMREVGEAKNLSPEVQLRIATKAAEAEVRDFDNRIAKSLRPEVKPKVDTAEAESKIKKMGTEAGGSAGSSGGKAFGGKFIGALAGIGFVDTIAGLASDAMAKASEKSKVVKNIQNRMGVSPEEAKMYGDRVGRAYASGLGDSQDQIAAVYSNLSSDVSDWAGRTMDSQDKVAARQVKVVQGLGTDMSMAIQASTAAVRNKLVPTFEDAQDLIARGFQILGSRGEDWAESLQEYSGYLRNLGMDGATALGVVKQGLDAGARSTDYILDAFKELNIRVIDGTKPVSDALKQIGLDAKKIPEQIAQGGPAALKAVDTIVDRIRGMKDPIAQNAVGVALFGTQWEDTMKQIIGSVDVGSAHMAGSFQGTVDKMTVATDTNVDKFQRRWERGLAVVGEKMSGWANDGAALIDGFTDHVIGSLEKKVGPLNPFKGITEAMEKLNRMRVEVKVRAEWEKVQDIHNRLMKLPPKTPLVVDALTANATSDLERLGYKVKTLPGGKVSISADTKPATDQAAATIRWLNSLYANITVGVVGPGKSYALKNTKGGMAAFATGGFVSGPGGVDNVPAWLTNKEHVTNAKDANKPENKAILKAINAGKPWYTAVPQAPGSTSSPGMGRGGGSGGGRPSVTFSGNTDTMFATLFQRAVRNGMIQIKVT
jgi:phage-related minor tail protein